MHHFYNTECGRVATSLWGGFFSIYWLSDYLSLGSNRQVNIFHLANKVRNSDLVRCFDIIEAVVKFLRGRVLRLPFILPRTTVPQGTLVQRAPECVCQHKKTGISARFAQWYCYFRWKKWNKSRKTMTIVSAMVEEGPSLATRNQSDLVYKMRHRLAMPCVG